MFALDLGQQLTLDPSAKVAREIHQGQARGGKENFRAIFSHYA